MELLTSDTIEGLKFEKEKIISWLEVLCLVMPERNRNISWKGSNEIFNWRTGSKESWRAFNLKERNFWLCEQNNLVTCVVVADYQKRIRIFLTKQSLSNFVLRRNKGRGWDLKFKRQKISSSDSSIGIFQWFLKNNFNACYPLKLRQTSIFKFFAYVDIIMNMCK